MSSLVSGALAGFSAALSNDRTQGVDDETAASPHYQYVHEQLLPMASKIQRELRGRRFRAVQAKLQEAILLLKNFERERWPPVGTIEEPEWMKVEKAAAAEAAKHNGDATNANNMHNDHSTENGNETDSMTVTTATVDDDLESTAGDFTTNPDSTSDDLDDVINVSQATLATTDIQPNSPTGATPNDQTESSATAAAATAAAASTVGPSTVGPSTVGPSTVGPSTTTNTKANTNANANTPNIDASAIVEDDPKTRQPMHAAIRALLEAFCLVMNHDSKTTKACQWVLDTTTDLVNKHYVSGRAGGIHDTSGSGAAYMRQTQAQQQEAQVVPPPQSLLHRTLEGICKCSESINDSVLEKVVNCNKAIVTSPNCGVHEASMLFALRGTFHVYLVGKTKDCQHAAKSALMTILRTVFGKMEAMEKAHPDQKSQYHTDAFVLFRSLCRLASKRLGDEDETPSTLANFAANFPAVNFFTMSTTTDPVALRNKVLSLELLQQVMECAGNAICQGERFIHLVQTQLCVTMLKNCMSNHTQVAFMSQRIFLVMVYKFKSHLKKEIEVFMSNIFLRVLDSPNSSLQQKALVLESLRSLCNDPVMLTQIFLNYDCDFEAMNLYKDIVFRLTKLGGKSAMPVEAAAATATKDALSDFDVSLSSVEVLVTILKAFLKALGLSTQPVSLLHDEFTNVDATHSEIDIAGSKIRSLLKLESVGGTLDMSKNSIHPFDGDNANGDMQQPATTEASATGTSGGLTTDDLARHTALSNADASSSDLAGRIVDAFDRKRNQEQNFELGAVKFTLSIKGGLNFFIDNGFVELDARSLARFLLVNKDKIDKTQTGEVLGKEPDAAFIKPKIDDGVPKEPIDAEKGGRGFYVRVLYYYTDAMDLAGLEFDEAIRLFLSGFRLPGEAQKIDRIMEKFAERYTRQNPDVFASADTAFILAFSVIMLNTDLHNPSIKPERRMTIDSFIANNRGIGENGADLDRDFLIGIFERIRDRPFSLKEDDMAREKVAKSQLDGIFFSPDVLFGASTEEKKKGKFQKERDEMLAATEQLIRRRPARGRAGSSGNGGNAAATATATTAGGSNGAITDNVSPADVVKPMFDVTWGPMIGILSQVLEFSNDERGTAVCLNGFVYAIRIAAHSGMSLARDTFVNSLAKLTFLGSIKEMKHKNIAAIKTLLSIAVQDGEYLEESWGSVLECISKLARMRMSASGLDADDSFLQDDGATVNATPRKTKSRPVERLADGTLFRQQTKAELSKETEENNGRAILESVNEVLIDKVFSSTVKLSSRSLASFIRQLVAVSMSEIEGSGNTNASAAANANGGGTTGAANGSGSISQTTGSAHGDQGSSIFSLQRLVEVADYNMHTRPRLVWKQIWQMVSDFFATIGCHKNGMVSVFAMDSLKQLSFKFLEKPELSDFNFQRMFLMPFLQVIENPGTRADIRELVLQCIDNIVQTRSHNLKSGWKIVFSIITSAANDPSDRINMMGLNIMQRLLDEHLELLFRLHDAADTESETSSQKAEGTKKDDDDTSPATEELSAFEQRNRNANAEDFIFMYSTSLAFIKQSSGVPSPASLSMRALCHVAIFADLLAERRVEYPVSGAQTTDPAAFGYTYEGLSEKEALELVLWRPLFESLASGIQSTEKSVEGGVGCLLHRGSVLLVRSIVLRYKHLFSIQQVHAIFDQTIVPAIQAAVEADSSRVVTIISESPAVSSLDFLVEAPPLPPSINDEGLHEFEMVARQSERSPRRKFGPVELIVEASFTDMRHGGDGDVSKAYKFLNKSVEAKIIDQPFPSSWIATTAPIALGLLTDVITEVAFQHGKEGKQLFWPMISAMISSWCNGKKQSTGAAQNGGNGDADIMVWSTCEALVRTSCMELRRLFNRLQSRVGAMDDDDICIEWANDIFVLFLSCLESTLREQEEIQSKLLRLKLKPYMNENNGGEANGDSSESPLQEQKSEDDVDWLDLVPLLKLRSISAHCLQQSLSSLDVPLLKLMQEAQISKVVELLDKSRAMAESAVEDGDLNHAFKEDMLSAWGVGMEEVGEEDLVNLAQRSTTQGSAMFFLTQSAGAANSIINVLTDLYRCTAETTDQSPVVEWEREKFAAHNLLDIIHDILTKFVDSESKEGHSVDPNEWRHAIEGTGKVAIYCTSFAGVVVGILKAMQGLEQGQMERLKSDFFPLICSLIRVQSQDIRGLVQKVLLNKFGPLMGIEPRAVA